MLGSRPVAVLETEKPLWAPGVCPVAAELQWAPPSTESSKRQRVGRVSLSSTLAESRAVESVIEAAGLRVTVGAAGLRVLKDCGAEATSVAAVAPLLVTMRKL